MTWLTKLFRLALNFVMLKFEPLCFRLCPRAEYRFQKTTESSLSVTVSPQPPSLPDADLAHRIERLEEEPTKVHRNDTQVDRDRLLYATSFARLAEVTQVISADHGYVFHNRLTHSLKVAQLSRRIAEKLLSEQPKEVAAAGGLDIDAAECAGLAHDLGHPPFGHIAEDVLDDEIKDIDPQDGYEGNAQSFRIVTKLAVGDPIGIAGNKPIAPSLNLTRVSLNGILKYPWLINGNPQKTNKWGAYSSEKDEFDWVRASFDKQFGGKVKSLEAEVMDWADDITYAVHDVVDFFCAGKIPLDRLGEQKPLVLSSFFEEVFNREGNEKLKDRRSELEKRFKHVCYRNFAAIEGRYTGICEERSVLWQMMTALITEYVGAFRIGNLSDPNSLVTIGKEAKDEIAMLKQLTWHYVINNADLATAQHGQKLIVKAVFKTLYEASAASSECRLLPPFYEELYRKAKSTSEKIRLVADCVSSMTEAEITTIYQKICGYKVGPML
jgi:dGTPase